MATDISAQRRELQERRQQLRELNNRARSILLQIFAYRAADEARRALSERLMVERNLQEGHRQERMAEVAGRIKQLIAEIEHLEKEARENPATAPAESAARAQAEKALETERERRARLSQQEEAENADHERLVHERHLALEKVAAADRSHDRLAARNDDSDETLMDVRGRADQLVEQIAALRTEVDTDIGREQQEVHEILAQLEVEQAALEECQAACAQLEKALPATPPPPPLPDAAESPVESQSMAPASPPPLPGKGG